MIRIDPNNPMFIHSSRVICTVDLGTFWRLFVFADYYDAQEATHWYLKSKFNDGRAFGTCLTKECGIRFYVENTIRHACEWLLNQGDWSRPESKDESHFRVVSSDGLFGTITFPRPDFALASWVKGAFDERWCLYRNELDRLWKDKHCMLVGSDSLESNIRASFAYERTRKLGGHGEFVHAYVSTDDCCFDVPDPRPVRNEHDSAQ